MQAVGIWYLLSIRVMQIGQLEYRIDVFRTLYDYGVTTKRALH